MTKPKQKLELTWVGKGEEPKREPRILLENPEYSYGDPDSPNAMEKRDFTELHRVYSSVKRLFAFLWFLCVR